MSASPPSQWPPTVRYFFETNGRPAVLRRAQFSFFAHNIAVAIMNAVASSLRKAAAASGRAAVRRAAATRPATSSALGRPGGLASCAAI